MHEPFVLRGCAIESNCVTTVVIQSYCIKGVCYYTIFTVIIYSYYMNIYWYYICSYGVEQYNLDIKCVDATLSYRPIMHPTYKMSAIQEQ